jgi:hypothetical protein
MVDQDHAGTGTERGRHQRGVTLLPPSGGPTQAGATPNLAFRAMIKAGGEVALKVAV